MLASSFHFNVMLGCSILTKRRNQEQEPACIFCRLITKIDYKYKKVYIRFVLTHKEYDKGGWKNDCGCQ